MATGEVPCTAARTIQEGKRCGERKVWWVMRGSRDKDLVEKERGREQKTHLLLSHTRRGVLGKVEEEQKVKWRKRGKESHEIVIL